MPYQLNRPDEYRILTVGDDNLIRVVDKQGRSLLHTTLPGAAKLLEELTSASPARNHGFTEFPSAAPQGLQLTCSVTSTSGEYWEDNPSGNHRVKEMILQLTTSNEEDLYAECVVHAEINLRNRKEISAFVRDLKKTIPKGTIPGDLVHVPRDQSVTDAFEDHGPLPFTVTAVDGWITVLDERGAVLAETDKDGATALLQLCETTQESSEFSVEFCAPDAHHKDNDFIRLLRHRSDIDRIDTLIVQRTTLWTYRSDVPSIEGEDARASIALIGKPAQDAFFSALKNVIPAGTPTHEDPERHLRMKRYLDPWSRASW